MGPAAHCLFLLLQRFGLGFLASLFLRKDLELFDRIGNFADFVLATQSWQDCLEIPGCKVIHRNAEGPHGSGDRDDGQQQGNDEDEGHNNAGRDIGTFDPLHLLQSRCLSILDTVFCVFNDLIDEVVHLRSDRKRHLTCDTPTLGVERVQLGPRIVRKVAACRFPCFDLDRRSTYCKNFVCRCRVFVDKRLHFLNSLAILR